jgi:hypothetical protein
MERTIIAATTPLLASPTRGEIPAGGWGRMVPPTPNHTSPLVGEDGRGVTMHIKGNGP